MLGLKDRVLSFRAEAKASKDTNSSLNFSRKRSLADCKMDGSNDSPAPEPKKFTGITVKDGKVWDPSVSRFTKKVRLSQPSQDESACVTDSQLESTSAIGSQNGCASTSDPQPNTQPLGASAPAPQQRPDRHATYLIWPSIFSGFFSQKSTFSKKRPSLDFVLQHFEFSMSK